MSAQARDERGPGRPHGHDDGRDRPATPGHGGGPQDAGDGTGTAAAVADGGTGSGDRIAGALLLLLALAYGIEARSFVVGFLADPLGPQALPLVIAALLALGAVVMIVRPDPDPAWPDGPARLRLAGAALSLVVYAVLLGTTGFLLTTTLEVALLSVLFGAGWRRSLVAAGAFSGVLYLLFVYGLGLALPVGSLFLRR